MAKNPVKTVENTAPAKARAKAQIVEDDYDELDYEMRLPFQHIIDSHSEYAFQTINDEGGQIAARLRKGWEVWKMESDAVYFDPGRKDRAQDEFASVPVGKTKGESGGKAYLLFMPVEMYNRRVLGGHDRRAKAQLAMVTDGTELDTGFNKSGHVSSSVMTSNVENVYE